jgi:hypothetical protein
MPRGGMRVGAGRPIGSGKAKPPGHYGLQVPADCQPLQFLLQVMRDPTVDTPTRMRAAASLLPYVHRRQAERVVGLRERQMEEARTAGRGSSWEYTDANGRVVNLLDPSDGRQQPDAPDDDDDGGWGTDFAVAAGAAAELTRRFGPPNRTRAWRFA